MLNKVILMGRLCADPEYRQTTSGVAMCRIRVAVDRGYVSKSTGERQADFINVTCWRQTAEFVSRYFHKGSMIIVEGSLQNNDYTDQNGVKHYSMVVSADNISFGESKSAAQSNGNYMPQNGGYAPQGNYQASYQQPSYSQPAQAEPLPPSKAAPPPASIQLGDLGDFEEILSDGEVPF